MSRTIETHHDGHGLNESIRILADEPDASGASHHYQLHIGDNLVALIQFQKGPRNVEGSTPGATEAAILAVLIDRIRGFQGGPWACPENDIVLSGLVCAADWTKERANRRAKRGVLGKLKR